MSVISECERPLVRYFLHAVLDTQLRLPGGRIFLNYDTTQMIFRDQYLVMRDPGQRSRVCQCLVGFMKVTRFRPLGTLVQFPGLSFCGGDDRLRFAECTALCKQFLAGPAQSATGGTLEPVSECNERNAHCNHNAEQKRPVFLPSVNTHVAVTARPSGDEVPDELGQSSLLPGGHGSSNGNGRRSLL
jgi:hypothetical protein